MGDLVCCFFKTWLWVSTGMSSLSGFLSSISANVSSNASPTLSSGGGGGKSETLRWGKTLQFYSLGSLSAKSELSTSTCWGAEKPVWWSVIHFGSFHAVPKHKIDILQIFLKIRITCCLGIALFILCCWRIARYEAKPGLLRHRNRKKMTSPLENHAFCAALEWSFWRPFLDNFGLWKKTQNKKLCCSGKS